MASNNLVIRFSVEASEAHAAIRVVLSRRNLVSAERRREIDFIFERGMSAEGMLVKWQEQIEPGRYVLHVTAGPKLLDLAMPEPPL